MDIFDHLEDLPERSVQQDEEQEAASTAGKQLEPPLVLWNSSLKARLYPNGVRPKFLIVASSKVACALVNHAFGRKQVLFSLVLPEVSMKGNTIQPSLQDRTCTASAVGLSGIVVSCQYDVPGERAKAVCNALMEELQPEQMLVLGSIRSEQYYGPGDASQDAQVFSLCTSETPKPPPTSSHPPPLPTGNTLGGLPAALLSHRQLRQQPCAGLVVLEMVPSLSVCGLQPLAQAAADVAQALGLQEVATELAVPDSLRNSCRELGAVCGSSLDNAVYT